jgi:hypothetical protein
MCSNLHTLSAVDGVLLLGILWGSPVLAVYYSSGHHHVYIHQKLSSHFLACAAIMCSSAINDLYGQCMNHWNQM